MCASQHTGGGLSAYTGRAARQNAGGARNQERFGGGRHRRRSGLSVLRLAAIVGPEGRVIAGDIQDSMIWLLRSNIEARKLTNVDIVLGTPTDPKLPAKAVDLVLMVDVYHEFSSPVVMMEHIRNALKPEGRLVLVEFRKEDPTAPIQPLHKMSIQEVRAELEPMGFELDRVLDFLPWQHVLIFTLK